VVNARFAALHVPGGEAIGRVLRIGPADGDAPLDSMVTIIGVVPNVRQADLRQASAGGAPEPVIYLTYAANPLPAATLVVRSDASIGDVASAIRTALADVDRDLALTQTPVPLGEAIARELGLIRVFSAMFGMLAAVSLALATLGLYAVTAYAVRQRTQELGVRLALGARARHVWWSVMRRAAGQLAVGVPLGLAGALAAGRLLQGAMLGMSGRDPITLIGVALLVVAVALAACARPAVRAIRMNAMAALRAE
jgi:hypothetical protein